MTKIYDITGTIPEIITVIDGTNTDDNMIFTTLQIYLTKELIENIKKWLIKYDKIFDPKLKNIQKLKPSTFIIGPYGSGKSLIANFLSFLVRDDLEFSRIENKKKYPNIRKSVWKILKKGFDEQHVSNFNVDDFSNLKNGKFLTVFINMNRYLISDENSSNSNLFVIIKKKIIKKIEEIEKKLGIIIDVDKGIDRANIVKKLRDLNDDEKIDQIIQDLEEKIKNEQNNDDVENFKHYLKEKMKILNLNGFLIFLDEFYAFFDTASERDKKNIAYNLQYLGYELQNDGIKLCLFPISQVHLENYSELIKKVYDRFDEFAISHSESSTIIHKQLLPNLKKQELIDLYTSRVKPHDLRNEEIWKHFKNTINQKEFVNNYPFHPKTLDFAMRLVERFSNQSRGLINYAYDYLETSLNNYFLDLITTDSLFDHFILKLEDPNFEEYRRKEIFIQINNEYIKKIKNHDERLLSTKILKTILFVIMPDSGISKKEIINHYFYYNKNIVEKSLKNLLRYIDYNFTFLSIKGDQLFYSSTKEREFKNLIQKFSNIIEKTHVEKLISSELQKLIIEESPIFEKFSLDQPYYHFSLKDNMRFDLLIINNPSAGLSSINSFYDKILELKKGDSDGNFNINLDSVLLYPLCILIFDFTITTELDNIQNKLRRIVDNLVDDFKILEEYPIYYFKLNSIKDEVVDKQKTFYVIDLLQTLINIIKNGKKTFQYIYKLFLDGINKKYNCSISLDESELKYFYTQQLKNLNSQSLIEIHEWLKEIKNKEIGKSNNSTTYLDPILKNLTRNLSHYYIIQPSGEFSKKPIIGKELNNFLKKTLLKNQIHKTYSYLREFPLSKFKNLINKAQRTKFISSIIKDLITENGKIDKNKVKYYKWIGDFGLLKKEENFYIIKYSKNNKFLSPILQLFPENVGNTVKIKNILIKMAQAPYGYPIHITGILILLILQSKQFRIRKKITKSLYKEFDSTYNIFKDKSKDSRTLIEEYNKFVKNAEIEKREVLSEDIFETILNFLNIFISIKDEKIKEIIEIKNAINTVKGIIDPIEKEEKLRPVIVLVLNNLKSIIQEDYKPLFITIVKYLNLFLEQKPITLKDVNTHFNYNIITIGKQELTLISFFEDNLYSGLKDLGNMSENQLSNSAFLAQFAENLKNTKTKFHVNLITLFHYIETSLNKIFRQISNLRRLQNNRRKLDNIIFTLNILRKNENIYSEFINSLNLNNRLHASHNVKNIFTELLNPDKILELHRMIERFYRELIEKFKQQHNSFWKSIEKIEEKLYNDEFIKSLLYISNAFNQFLKYDIDPENIQKIKRIIKICRPLNHSFKDLSCPSCKMQIFSKEMNINLEQHGVKYSLDIKNIIDDPLLVDYYYFIMKRDILLNLGKTLPFLNNSQMKKLIFRFFNSRFNLNEKDIFITKTISFNNESNYEILLLNTASINKEMNKKQTLTNLTEEFSRELKKSKTITNFFEKINSLHWDFVEQIYQQFSSGAKNKTQKLKENIEKIETKFMDLIQDLKKYLSVKKLNEILNILKENFSEYDKLKAIYHLIEIEKQHFSLMKEKLNSLQNKMLSKIVKADFEKRIRAISSIILVPTENCEKYDEIKMKLRSIPEKGKIRLISFNSMSSTNHGYIINQLRRIFERTKGKTLINLSEFITLKENTPEFILLKEIFFYSLYFIGTSQDILEAIKENQSTLQNGSFEIKLIQKNNNKKEQTNKNKNIIITVLRSFNGTLFLIEEYFLLE